MANDAVVLWSFPLTEKQAVETSWFYSLCVSMRIKNKNINSVKLCLIPNICTSKRDIRVYFANIKKCLGISQIIGKSNCL